VSYDIYVKTIAHNEQRYNTVGDYYTNDEGQDQLRVSEDTDHVYEMAVILHELVEMCWARDHGVGNDIIDAFDNEFEQLIRDGKESEDAEPGDHPDCPVYEGHQMASVIERAFITMMGRSWKFYDQSMMVQVKERMRRENQ
jgi:hypothetical protein